MKILQREYKHILNFVLSKSLITKRILQPEHYGGNSYRIGQERRATDVGDYFKTFAFGRTQEEAAYNAWEKSSEE